MWNTSTGKRTLKGAEAALVAEGLLTLIDDSSVWNFEDYPMGIKAYDDLTPGQQVSALRTIANGLFADDVKPIKHTAALEGAIATVFRQIEDRLEVELDDTGSGFEWRKLVVAVRKAADAEDVLPLECADHDAWQFEIEQIEDNILWDNDFDTSNLFMDLPPEQSETFRELMGIPKYYALTIPDDLTKEQIETTIAEIRKLCSRVIVLPD
ncbi:MAG: hypothetical protein HQ515_03590 [Phycisphaeraceae bacterium]|nr:hypothetical protein [Phycisphaeraceae bacterium]